jgi:hypothetical protein
MIFQKRKISMPAIPRNPKGIPRDYFPFEFVKWLEELCWFRGQEKGEKLGRDWERGRLLASPIARRFLARDQARRQSLKLR